MRTLLTTILAISLAGVASIQAQPKTWGETKCGARLALSTPERFKMSAPAKLSVWVQNISDQPVYLLESEPVRDFRFTVLAPDGKQLQPKVPPIKREDEEHTRRSQRLLKPTQSAQFKINLSTIFSFDREGQYTITAERRVLKPDGSPCELQSNTVQVAVQK